MLPANTLLRFDFETPSRTLHFDYQLCRGAGAPFESFRCPQDALSAEPNDTHALFVYKNSSGIDDIWVVIPTFMQGTTDTFDQLVSGVHWVLPYDLEEACDSAGCDPGETELESPYLRRETFPKDGGFFPVNPNARWVIRSGRKVTWNAADVYAGDAQRSQIGFRHASILRIDGELEVRALAPEVFTLTSVEPLSGGLWWGIHVSGGRLSLKGVIVDAVGNDPYLPSAVRTYGGEVILTDGSVISGTVLAGRPGLYVAGTSGHATIERGSSVRNGDGPGVWVDAGASALIAEESRISDNAGAGVSATGYGTVVHLHEAIIEDNAGPGVEAGTDAEVFFARTDTQDPNPQATSIVRYNVEGSISAVKGASLIAGISDGQTCIRFCGNWIERADVSGTYDARAESGGVNYAEANFWGFGVDDPSDLVLLEDAQSFLSVQPILTSPPSVSGGTGAVLAGAPASASGGTAPAPDGLGTVRSLAASARSLAAIGDTTRAVATLAEALAAAESEDERALAYSTATVLLGRIQMPAIVVWLEGVVSAGPARPWALRALAVARATSGEPDGSASAAQALAREYGGSTHGLFGRAHLVRLAVEASDEAGALAALEALAQAFPEAAETLRARLLVVAAFPGIDPDEALRSGAFGAAGTDTDERGPTRPLSLVVRPNPLLGAAAVTFVLEAESAVEVTLYDALGRSVAVLHKGALPPGPRELAFDGAGFAPGVYVVRVTAHREAGGPARTAVRRVTLGR